MNKTPLQVLLDNNEAELKKFIVQEGKKKKAISPICIMEKEDEANGTDESFGDNIRD